jgi:thiol-disulfide isomerase/thioredoxin
MKNIYNSLFIILLVSMLSTTSSAQTTAMDFQGATAMAPCTISQRVTDSGNIVILEFFMDSCTFCVDAAHALEAMMHTLKATYHINVVYYAIGYNNLYPKPQVANWVGVNHLRAIPMDSGKAMVNYYGGFGMPTVVILGGSSHSVISSAAGLPAQRYRHCYRSGDVLCEWYHWHRPCHSYPIVESSIYPNPVSEKATIKMDIPAPTFLHIAIADMGGQAIMTTSEQPTAAGPYMTTLDVSTLPRGIYLVTITTDGRSASRESILR